MASAAVLELLLRAPLAMPAVMLYMLINVMLSATQIFCS
jgi:hypothetical protein